MEMEGIQDLPMEMQLQILQYPMDANVAKMMLSNTRYRGIAQMEIMYLQASREGEVISSKLVLNLPNLISVVGYIIRVESLDDLLILAERQKLLSANFDLFLLGITNYGKLGLENSKRELRKRLEGRYYTIDSLEKPKNIRIHPIDPYTTRPDNVASYVTYFLFHRFSRSNSSDLFLFRFYTGPRFLLEISLLEGEVSNGNVRATPRGYIKELRNILTVFDELRGVHTLTSNISPELGNYLRHLHLKRINLYTSHIRDLENLRDILYSPLVGISIYDPEKIRSNLDSYTNTLRKFFESGVIYRDIKFFVPVDAETLSDAIYTFPNLEEISYIHISGEEIPWNELLGGGKKVTLFSLEEVDSPDAKVQVISL